MLRYWKRAYENARGFESNQETTKSIAVAEVELDKEAHELAEHCAVTTKENWIYILYLKKKVK